MARHAAILPGSLGQDLIDRIEPDFDAAADPVPQLSAGFLSAPTIERIVGDDRNIQIQISLLDDLETSYAGLSGKDLRRGRLGSVNRLISKSCITVIPTAAKRSGGTLGECDVTCDQMEATVGCWTVFCGANVSGPSAPLRAVYPDENRESG